MAKPKCLFGPDGYFTDEQFRRWHPHLCCSGPGRTELLDGTHGAETIRCCNCGAVSRLMKLPGQRWRRWVRLPTINSAS